MRPKVICHTLAQILEIFKNFDFESKLFRRSTFALRSSRQNKSGQ